MTGRNVHSLDDGCDEVASSCLNCPLPECRYDNPIAYQAFRRAQVQEDKKKKVLELWMGGVSALQIGRDLKVRPKTVNEWITQND